MFKKLLFLLIFLVITTGVFAQSIPSGTGRYEALGLNPFITDPALDLVRNPAWGNLYRNYTFGDIGRADLTDPNLYKLKNQYVGVNFGLGTKVFGGLILNKNEGRMFDSVFYVSSPWGMGALGMDVPIVPVKAFFGFSPNAGKFTLAGSIYYTQKSQDSTMPTNFSRVTDTTSITNFISNYNLAKKSSVFGFTLGTVANFKDSWLEGNVDMKFNNFNYSSSRDTNISTTLHQKPPLGDTTIINQSHKTSLNVENDGSMEFNAYVRGMITVNKANNIKLVPYINFGFFNWKPKYTPANSSADTLPVPAFRNTSVYAYEYRYMNLIGGVGINMPVFESGLLGFGLSFGYNSYTLSASETYTSWSGVQPPISDTIKTVTTNKVDYKKTSILFPKLNLGLEWKFTDWMTGRIGYSRAVISDKIDGTSVNSTVNTKVSSIPGGSYVINSSTTNNPSNIINDQNPTDPIQTVSLGLGFHFSRFSIDGLIGEKFFQKGVNLFSGQDDKEMFGVLSASYNFNIIK